MNFKRYQNEIIVGAAFLIMSIAYLYKEIQVSYQGEAGREIQKKIDEVNRVVALKKVWGNPRISGRIEKLKQVVSSDKVTWNKKRSQLDVVYSGISAEELNQVGKIVLNLSVQIKKFYLQKEGTSYRVELVCKW